MSLGTPVVGTIVYKGVWGGSFTLTYPSGISSGDCVLIIVGQKGSDTGYGSITTPTGYTMQAERQDGGGYLATPTADTGDTHIRVYSKNTVSGTEGGTTINVSDSDTNVLWGVIVHIPSSGGTLAYGSSTGHDTTDGNVSVTLAADPGFSSGDMALIAMSIATDGICPTQFGTIGISATGATFGTPAKLAEPFSVVGYDIGGFLAYASCTGGPSSAASTVTATVNDIGSNARGPLAVLRIREAALTHAVTGALVGPGSTLAGTAARSVILTHTTTGALIGPGSTVSATAARSGITVTHTSTGALVGQGSTLTASASKFDLTRPSRGRRIDRTSASQRRH